MATGSLLSHEAARSWCDDADRPAAEYSDFRVTTEDCAQAAFERFGIYDVLPRQRIFRSVDEAVRALAAP